MQFIIMTDLEGVAGVDRFSQTRTSEVSEKIEGMKQLAAEVNACVEARRFVPKIETVATKVGTGLESAVHRDAEEACQLIRQGAERAVKRLGEFESYRRLGPPYQFEARHTQKLERAKWAGDLKVSFVDDYTYRIETENIRDLPL